MTWNYRVVKFISVPGDIYFDIKEVYYDKNKKINGYGDASLLFESVKDMKSGLRLMREALDKPVLDYDDIKGGK